jgi:hypothetical protein
VGLIGEWILWTRRPDLDYFKRRPLAEGVELAWQTLWKGRTAAIHWLAYMGGLVGYFTVQRAELQRTTSWLLLLSIVVVLSGVAALGGTMIIRTPRLASEGLLVVSGLLAVVAASVPLFHLDGSEWLKRGWHLSYFLAASAVLVGSAGVLAAREVRRLSGPPPIYTPPYSAA